MIEQSAINSSRAIWRQALERYPQPFAIVLALSGGNDSRATYYAAKELGIPITHILHIHTGTGIQETTDWVRWFATDVAQIPYLEGTAGDRFERRVLEKGFIGRGLDAHGIAFHLLKRDVLTGELAKLRLRKRNRPILILNGARASESLNRSKNLSQPIRPDKPGSSNVWVNLLHYWDKPHCAAICEAANAPQNPVARELCRSGECMCGTTQEPAARAEASILYPEWGEWLDDLERRVKERFPWGWGEGIPKSWANEKAGQLRLFGPGDFQPMCTSCTAPPSSLTEAQKEAFRAANVAATNQATGDHP
jgi:3'-phosphoadenosine 5'-phosphosulfate sulfotransferase (PAPS reductase)/FAD synthetase